MICTMENKIGIRKKRNKINAFKACIEITARSMGQTWELKIKVDEFDRSRERFIKKS